MPRLPRISGEEAIRVLERMGFTRVRQKGSHIIMKKITSDGTVGCPVPLHDELALGTLRSILRLAKITPEEFIAHL